MSGPSLFLVTGVLIGVLALIGAAAKLFQRGFRRLQSPAGRTLILQETIALDPRRRLHLVQCGQRQVVLLTGGSQDLVIGWMQDP
jgi:flagellar protein FliO/FliZ